MSEDNKVSLPAFYGQKAGMTRIFDESGKHVPVTVIKLIPNVISQVKTPSKEGYSSYQLAYYEKREKLLTKANKGHLAKAGVDKLLCRFAELRLSEVSEDTSEEIIIKRLSDILKITPVVSKHFKNTNFNNDLNKKLK